ncbi:MAG TPA: hypothetical protein VMU67_03710 [Steroidobacteraceae bacterium]|nr:hypothetical protein [Steroidobacteraceae bacterium]
MSGPKQKTPDGSGELARLRVTVRHLSAAWPTVLQRRHFLRAMARSEALRSALEKTYAGHVFNAMHGAMSFDLVRAVGALILDHRRRSASLWHAVASLRKSAVVKQLRAQVYPDPEMQLVGRANAEIHAALARIHRNAFDTVFNDLPAQLEEIDTTVFATPVARTIKDVRDKVVAHAAVEHDGTDWKIWVVNRDTNLTYAQLDDYIDACTKAVDRLNHLVLRTAFSFDDLPGIDQGYVNEYIDALLIGLREQKQEKERQREERLKRTQELTP